MATREIQTFPEARTTSRAHTVHPGRVLAAIERGARAIGSAIGRLVAASYVGPDYPREVGRHTGARC